MRDFATTADDLSVEPQTEMSQLNIKYLYHREGNPTETYPAQS